MCKIALSEQQGFTVEIPFFTMEDGVPVDLAVEITREEFSQITAPLLIRAKQCLETALSAAKASPDSIDRVLLVGGTTYIPAVRDMVASVLRCPLSMDVPPDLAVSMGTGIMANMKQQRSKGEVTAMQLIDGFAYGIGVEILAGQGHDMRLIYD